MRIAKILGGVGALTGAALLGGAMISGALAGTAPETAPAAAAGEDHPMGGTDLGVYLDTYLDPLAAELGVERADLGPAAIAAAEATIDAAVEAGDIDDERAAALKARLAELDDPAAILLGQGAIVGFAGPGPDHPARDGFPGRDGWHGGPGFGFGIGDAVQAAATALDMEVPELFGAFRDGSDLKALAEQRGVDYATVSGAVIDSVGSSLATAVENGHLEQERADQIAAAIEQWLADGGDLGAHLPRGFPGVPWDCEGPDVPGA